MLFVPYAYVYQKVFNNYFSKIYKSVQTTQVKIVIRFTAHSKSKQMYLDVDFSKNQFR